MMHRNPASSAWRAFCTARARVKAPCPPTAAPRSGGLDTRRRRRACQHPSVRCRALLAGYILAISPAAAHDWYPSECCSGQDCRPVPCSEVTFDAAHNVAIYKPTGGATSSPPRISHDADCHVCILPHASSPLCVFLPGVS